MATMKASDPGMQASINPLLHRHFLDHDINFCFVDIEKIHEKFKLYFLILLKILLKMEHLLFWSKCSIFNNIFKYIFQRRQNALL